jgi:hypothetical protein
MPKIMVPDGMYGWAVFEKSRGRVSELFQSRELAENAAQMLGGAGYEVRFGYVEKRTGTFMTRDLEKQR